MVITLIETGITESNNYAEKLNINDEIFIYIKS